MKCLIGIVLIAGLMVLGSAANARCSEDGQRSQLVHAMWGARQLDFWTVNPDEIHRVLMPNGFDVGIKIDNETREAYARVLPKHFAASDELVRISLYDMTGTEPRQLTFTYGGANSLQGYSDKGGADRVVELGHPGLTLFLRKPVCVISAEVGLKDGSATDASK